ncbi:MAG: ion transporter [Bacteroidales bacterium]|nr:ion transporter [Bacteroidales bacterium]HOY38013.1 ion channel [Bacteroidales bacterium]HQP04305.1 ion channel [Bacteroidales bacterium]
MWRLTKELFKRYIRAILLLTGVFLLILLGILAIEFGAGHSTIHNYFEAIWYGFVTIAGVGYGDYTPVTTGGRILGMLLIIGSLLLVGIFTGQITNEIRKIMEDKKMGIYGTKMTGHFVIIGWDSFASNVAEWVLDAGKDLAIITNNPADIDLIYNRFGNKKVFALFSDFDKPESFDLVNIDKSASVFINFKEDSETLVHLINIRKKYPRLNYVASLNNSQLKDTFHAAGITFSVSNNEVASKLVASYIFEPDVANFTEDIMASANMNDDYDMVEYQVFSNNPYANKDYYEAFFDLKTKYNCVLLGISRKIGEKYTIIKNPKKGEIIRNADFLIMLADGSTKPQIEQLFGTKEGRCVLKS